MPVVRVPVRVTPRSARNEIAGWEGDELHVRVTVPAEAGRANAAVCSLVGKALDSPKSSVRVVRGAASRHKSLEVDVGDGVDVWGLLGRS